MSQAERGSSIVTAVTMPRYSRVYTPTLIIGIMIGVITAFARGMTARPVAEDFYPPEVFLIIRQGELFRPGFSFPLILLRELFGPIYDAPLPFHLFSLAIHVATTIAVLLLVSRLSNLTTGTIAAIIFGFTPRAHEAVFWSAAASHPIMTMAMVYSLLLYISAQADGALWKRIISLALFVYGLLTHEASIVVLSLFLTYDLLWASPGLTKNWRSTVLKLAPFLAPYFIVLGIFVVIMMGGRGNMGFQVATGRDTSFYNLSLDTGKLKDLGSFLSYSLFHFVPLRSVQSMVGKLIMFALALIVIIGAIWKGDRLTRYGAIWVVLSITPYVLFVPYGTTDRYFYLASIGTAMIISGIVSSFINWIQSTRRLSPQGSGILLVCLLAAYTVAGFSELQACANEWLEAGEVTHTLLEDLYHQRPDTQPDDIFYFINLPRTIGRAYTLNLGIVGAVHTHYNMPDLRVYESRDPGLIKVVEDSRVTTDGSGMASESGDRVNIFLFQDDKLVDISRSWKDPTVRESLELIGPKLTTP